MPRVGMSGLMTTMLYNFYSKQQGWTFLLVQNQDEFEYYEKLSN